MSNLTNEELCDLFDKTFPNMSFEDVSKILCTMNDEYTDDLRYHFCGLALDIIIRGYFHWSDDYSEYIEGSLIALFVKQSELLDPPDPFYQAVTAFIEKDYPKCLKMLNDTYRGHKEITYTASDIGYGVLSVFKNAFPGFWEHMRGIFSHTKTAPGLFEMIDAIETFYENDNTDIIIDKLSKVLQIDNNCVAAKELLAFTYFNNKMWNNAAALFEQIEKPDILNYDDLYFNMAYTYEKIKDYNEAEKYYKKCLKINTNYTFATNNLGYVYIKKKDFSKAVTTLKKCLKNDYIFDERKCASNNIVIAYIGANKLNEAENFISQSKIKLWKYTIDKFNAAKNKKNYKNNDDNEIQSIPSKKISFNEKSGQFSSEKILEDELVARIENGQSVFGKNLKIR